jgi:BRCA1-associated protein
MGRDARVKMANARPQMSAHAYAAVVSRDDGDADETDALVSVSDSACERAFATTTASAGTRVVRGRVRLFKTRGARDDGVASTDAEASEGVDARPRDRTAVVCVIGVPSAMSVADFCRFAAGAADSMKSMRVVAPTRARDGEVMRSSYDALLEFEDRDGADVFVDNYYGRRLASGRAETCVALYVASVEYEDGDDSRTTASEARTEVPTCPVCLDRLDAEVSGIVTTICNHSFHAECLSGWADASCPVCRYTHEPEVKATCASCGKDHDLWVCLICGEVRCGRYAGACAVEHWRETNHTYSLELGTQRVWDYVSDGFVHRLIQSKAGLVELSPPVARRGSMSSAASGYDGAPSCSPRPPDVSDLDAELEEALVASKLDAIASEYDVLLTSQLESQRKYFENLLQAANARNAGTISRENEETMNAAVVARAMQDVKDVKRELSAAKKTNADQTKTITQLRDENGHLKSMSDTLAENVEAFKMELARSEKRKTVELALKDARIKELEEENRDLMLFLDTSSKLSTDTALAEEISGGTVVGIDTDTKPKEPARNATHERLRDRIDRNRP